MKAIAMDELHAEEKPATVVEEDEKNSTKISNWEGKKPIELIRKNE